MKHKTIGLALLVLTPMLLASCGKTTSNVITACIASAPKTIDPATNSSVDGGTYDEHLFEGLYRWNYTGTYPNGAVSLVPGQAVDAPTKVTNSDGTVTYTYTLRDGLKWSDGTTLTANDYVRSWKRAVSKKLGSPYNYLFEALKGGVDAEGEDDGASLAVSATDDKTLVVTLANECSYWNELSAFPTFAPVPATADLDGAWASPENASTFVCNGPMKIKAFDDTKIEMVPNPNYVGTVDVKAKDIAFVFSDDDSAMLNSFEKGSYDFIDSFPSTETDTIKANHKGEYFNVGQLGTYYYCWNVNMPSEFNTVLDTEAKRQTFRQAVCLLINRQYLIDNIAKGDQVAADGWVSVGLTEADGKTDWTADNGPKRDGAGYYDASSAGFAANETTALGLLKSCGFTYDDATKKFTNVPSFEFVANNGDAHLKIAQVLQNELKNLGITMTIKQQDWAIVQTIRQNGQYTLSRNGWLCDYNDPISELDMFTTASGNNDCQLGKGTNATYAGYSVDMNADGTIDDTEKNLTWAQSYDALIAKVKATVDNTLRFKLMHCAEDLLMSTWCVMPIYYYTDAFLMSSKLSGFYAMPLGYKFFYGCTKAA
jgi:ABC-type oligopeptide transport system substrate-binding subunit